MNLGPLNFIQSGALPTARVIWLAVIELIWQSLKCTQKWERKMSYRIKVIKAGTSIYIDISSYVDINDVRPYFESLHHLNMQNQKFYIFLITYYQEGSFQQLTFCMMQVIDQIWYWFPYVSRVLETFCVSTTEHQYITGVTHNLQLCKHTQKFR